MALPVAYNCSGSDIATTTKTTLPFGYLFWPTGNELLQCFLVNKVLGRPLTYNQIQDVDVYAHNPDRLNFDISYELDTFGSQIWGYFFMYRKPNSYRRAPGGYWKVIRDEQKVIGEESQIIGYKKILKFYSEDASDGEENKFVMQEYTLNPNAFDELKGLAGPIVENYAVCVVTKVLCPPWRIEMEEECDTIFEEESESYYEGEESDEEEMASPGNPVS